MACGISLLLDLTYRIVIRGICLEYFASYLSVYPLFLASTQGQRLICSARQLDKIQQGMPKTSDLLTKRSVWETGYCSPQGYRASQYRGRGASR